VTQNECGLLAPEDDLLGDLSTFLPSSAILSALERQPLVFEGFVGAVIGRRLRFAERIPAPFSVTPKIEGLL
jgi:hypothetical protein